MIDRTNKSHATDRHAAAGDVATAVAPPVSIAFHTLEEADRQHLSAHFWRWCELFDRDPDARITQHPEHLLSQQMNDSLASAAASAPRSSAAIEPTGGLTPNGTHFVSGTALAAGNSSENVDPELPVASAIPLKVSAIRLTPAGSPRSLRF